MIALKFEMLLSRQLPLKTGILKLGFQSLLYSTFEEKEYRSWFSAFINTSKFHSYFYKLMERPKIFLISGVPYASIVLVLYIYIYIYITTDGTVSA